jgi:hypothetical protein
MFLTVHISLTTEDNQDNSRKLFLTPLARYWVAPCCDNETHHSNYRHQAICLAWAMRYTPSGTTSEMDSSPEESPTSGSSALTAWSGSNRGEKNHRTKRLHSPSRCGVLILFTPQQQPTGRWRSSLNAI